MPREAAGLRQVRRGRPCVLPHVHAVAPGRTAHLDGLAVGVSLAPGLCLAAQGCGEVFALAVRALESRDEALFERVLALVFALPDAARGVGSALGWVSPADLQGVVGALLASTQPVPRVLGLTACRMHRVDPGRVLLDGLGDAQPEVRAAALRAAGELGRLDLLEHARHAMMDEHADVKHQAAVAACLLGDRQDSLQLLATEALQQPTPQGDRALALMLSASSNDTASAMPSTICRSASCTTSVSGCRTIT